MDHPMITCTYWENAGNDDGIRFGLQYRSGNRVVQGLKLTVDEARAAAVELGARIGVNAELFDVVARRAARAESRDRGDKRNAERRLYEHMKVVVCGDVDEAPLAQEGLPDLEFSDAVVALPTLGGIISDLPLSAETERRFPESVRLPVTVSAAKYDEFVVTEYRGRGVAMTVREAYERGLREAPKWIPDLSGVPAVPTRSDFSAAGID